MIDQHANAGRRDEAALEAGGRNQEAKETAQEVRRDLKAQSQGVARQAKEAAEGEIDRRSTNLADRLESVGHAMRLAAEDLEGEGQEWIADYTRHAAGQVERVPSPNTVTLPPSGRFA